jgi:hypothetical protein
MKNKEEVYAACRIEGMVIKLPDVQLERKLYMEVAKGLEIAGGKWKGGKVGGFVFGENPEPLLELLKIGEGVNYKKEYQFFETPESVVDFMVGLVDLVPDGKTRILEPSAGQGAIVKGIRKLFGEVTVDCFELMELNRMKLKAVPGVRLMGEDFEMEAKYFYKSYDLIIANPPFSKNQDIDHIREMYACLASGGQLISVASTHWKLSNNRKEREFRDWLEFLGAEEFPIEPGRFKESGTMVGSVILEIVKD